MGLFLLSRHKIKPSTTDTRLTSPGTENALRSMRMASAATGNASIGIKAMSAGTGLESAGRAIASVEPYASPSGVDPEMWREYCKTVGAGAAVAGGTEAFHEYCAALGIGTNASPSVGGPEVFREYCTTLGIDMEKGATSFDDRVRKEYTLHTLQYWLVASLANGLLWAQIVIGAALTALGATRTHASQTATIYLGAASTIIAGLLTYFKSRNQPNRARQFRQALRAIRNRIDDTVGDLQEATPEQARELARDIMKQYKDALADAENNYPDDWMTLATLKKFLPGDGSGDGSGSNNGQLMGLKTANTGPYQVSGQDMTTALKFVSNGKEPSSASDSGPPESTTEPKLDSSGKGVPTVSGRETPEAETPGQEKSVLMGQMRDEEVREERRRRRAEETAARVAARQERMDKAAAAGEETRSPEKFEGPATLAEADVPGRQFAEKDMV